MDPITLLFAGPWLLRLAVALLCLPVILFLDLLSCIASNSRLRYIVIALFIWLSGIWVAAWILADNKVAFTDQSGVLMFRTFSASYRLLTAGLGGETVRMIQRVASIAGRILRLISDCTGFFAGCFEYIAAWE